MKRFTLSFFFALLVSSAAFSQTGSLVLNKGEKYLIENRMSGTGKQEMMGQSMESKAEMTAISSVQVKDVTDKNYNLTNNLLHMKANVSAMGQEMKFDSDKKEDLESSQGPDLTKVINHPKDVVVDKTGKILIAKKAETKSDANDMTSAMLSKLLGENPSDESFGLQMLFITLPKNVVAGYSWLDSASTGSVKKQTRYTVKDIKGSDATIAISGTNEVNSQDEMQGMEVTTKTKGTIIGEEIVDVQSGVLKSRTTTIETNGTVSAQGMDIPMNNKMTSVVTVKKS